MSRTLVLGLIFLSVAQFWKLPLIDAHLNQIEQINIRELEQEVQRTLLDLSQSLMLLQKESGEWDGILEGDPSYDAMMLILGQQLGTLTEELKAEIFERIFHWEGYHAGLWAAYPGGAPSLDVTGVVLYGLKAAGLDAGDPRVSDAWNWFESQGGWQRLHPLNQFFLAVGGSLPADVVPHISPKFLALPKWFPINIHNIGIIRIIIVPLSVWSYYKKFSSDSYFSKSFALDRGCSEDEAFENSSNDAIKLHKILNFISSIQNSSALHRSVHTPWRKFLDEFMALIDQDISFSKEFSAQVGICWLLNHQQVDGTWAGVIPSTYLSMLALSEADRNGVGDFGDEMAHAWSGLIGWRRFIHGSGTIQQLSEGPVMETARALNAFYSVPLNLRLLSDLEERNAIDWLIKQQIRKSGDWSYNLPLFQPGGWAYQYYNDFYPDTDDTAMVLEALIRSQYRYKIDVREAINLGIDWLLAMQNRDGGFPVWTHETSPIVRRLFSENKTMEALIEPSQVDVTSRALKALVELKKEPHLYEIEELKIAIESACSFITRKAQKIDGVAIRVWEGNWMVNYLYGTAEVLDALLKVGCWEIGDAAPYIYWFSSLQNEDGGWGESPLSFMDERYVPAHSTISQTAFILNALLTYEKERIFRAADTVSAKTSILRGIQYLVNQAARQEYVIETDYTGVILKKLSYGRYYRLAQYETVRVLGEFLTWYWGQESAEADHEVMTVTDQTSR